MLKERAEFVRTVLYFVDLLIITVAFFFSHYFFFHFRSLYKLDLMPSIDLIKTPADLNLYLRVYLLSLVIWAVLLRARGQYHLRVQTYPKMVAVQLLNGFIFFGIFSSAAFIFRFEFVSRLLIIFYICLCILLILSNRFLTMYTAYRVRSQGHNYRNVLLVGTGNRARDFMNLIVRHKEWGYRIVGVLDQEARKVGQSVYGHPIVGTLENLPQLLEKSVVDEVVFVVPRSWLKEIEKSILYCEAVGVPATLSTDFFDLEIARGVPMEMEGKTFLSFQTRRLRDPELLVKRTMDIVFSLTVLIVTSPLLLLLIFVVKLTSKGPVFFKQIRSGRSGRKFVLYKFRSMVEGAEQKLEELRRHNEMSGPVFKMENDPRLTRIGKFLRKTSLDEFPQFWNVLKGDMSLVGPRPPLPSEVLQYEPWQRRRLSMKPGITCLWQVSGRNEINFENWMKLDLRYIDNWSVWLDLKILVQTVQVVLTGRGAK